MTRGLRWGLKRSFRDYVEAIDDGGETVDAGARIDGGGFFFPLAEDAEVLRFSGRVELSGYNGLLELRIEDPWVERNGEGWALSIIDPTSRSRPRPRLPLGLLAERPAVDGVADRGTFDVLDARLAPSGVRLFDGVYPADTPLEPVELVGVLLPPQTARPPERPEASVAP